jgi:hypothetical protein
LETEYTVNGRASKKRLRESLKHLKQWFGLARAVAVDTAAINRYVANRQSDGAANATINRELAALPVSTPGAAEPVNRDETVRSRV